MIDYRGLIVLFGTLGGCAAIGAFFTAIAWLLMGDRE